MLLFGELPPLFWLDDEGDATIEADALTMAATERVDWFNDPATGEVQASAPALMFLVDADFQLSATVTVDFGATFDAGVLFVHQSGNDWAKLCFERAPSGEPSVVSVVTRGVSDDANGPTIDSNTVRLRISRVGRSFAFHYSTVGGDVATDDGDAATDDGDAAADDGDTATDDGDTATDDGDAATDVWHLVRLFALRDPDLPVQVGFLSQSPTGPGCTTQFDNVVLSATTLADARDGS